MSDEVLPAIVIVTGPTASGKTPVAIDFALRFDGEIVNADSMQVFRHMDIGTAKPTLEQRAAVPHHMIDVVTPDVPYSAGRYADETRAVVADLHARGKCIFLTGGTGLYIRAVVEGLLSGVPADPALREDLAAEHESALSEGDPLRLHRRLEHADPQAAEKIHPNDLRRVIRALEIHTQSGRTATTLRGDHGFCERRYRVLHLALDRGREELARRIDERCRAMVDKGLLQEVRALRSMGYGSELHPMQSIGYRHMNTVADGHDTLEMALESMQRDTRQFARRQRTWLRKVEGVQWVNPAEIEPVSTLIEAFLKPD